MSNNSLEYLQSLAPKEAPKTSQEYLKSLSPAPSVDTPFNFSSYVTKYDRIDKDVVAKDPILKNMVFDYLDARKSSASGIIAKSGRVASKVSGASVIQDTDFRSLPFDDVWELYEEHQRSFHGGHSVTTLNELSYALNAPDEVKKKLGGGYVLWDSMSSPLTSLKEYNPLGGEAWDVIGDYTQAAVWDPTTIMTLGIGRAFTAGASKTSTFATKKALKSLYLSGIKSGMTKKAAKKAAGASVRKSIRKGGIKETLKNTAIITAPDVVFNVGTDALYQTTRIETESQKEWSGLQSAVSAAGAVATPAILASSGLIKTLRNKIPDKQFRGYEEVNQAFIDQGKKKIGKIVKSKTNIQQVVDSLDAQFGKIKGDTSLIKDWGDVKVEATLGIVKRKEKVNDMDAVSRFESFFMLGNPTKGQKGFIQALHDAGFVLHEALIDKHGTKSGVIAETIKWLDDSVVEKAMKAFEKAEGAPLGFEYTAEAFSQMYAKRSSDLGRGLNLRKLIGDIEKAGGPGANAAVRTLVGANDKESAKWGQFAMSTYKRLLTSHLATTGANLKGFGVVKGLNTLADFFTAGINSGQMAYYSLKGDVDKAVMFDKRFRGALHGATNTLMSVNRLFDPNDDFEAVETILNNFPKAREDLFRDVAGDGGTLDSKAAYNLADSKAAGVIDWVTSKAQHLTGVRMQDEITKKWAFGTNLETALRREYGVGIEDFFKNPNNVAEWSTERFQENVLEKAVFRTLRETASVNWSTRVGQTHNWMLKAAKAVEFVSNRTPAGIVFPFGAFMNTTIATMGDLTGINAIRSVVRKAAGTGIKHSSQETEELVAKAVVGWGAVLAGVPHAKERIAGGVAWNQEGNKDGSLEDITYDWPASTLRLMSQITAHADQGDEYDWSQVPEGLRDELKKQLFGQAARDFEEVFSMMGDSFDGFFSGDTGLVDSFLKPMASRVAQGITRPLDPLNTLVGVVNDREMSPDLRQGAKNWNEATRYVSHLFNMQQQEKRNYPVGTGMSHTDLGKQVLGVRITSPNTLFGKMLNSSGRPQWKATRWDGPPELKNYMDGLIQPLFEAESRRVLKKYPTFFDLPQDRKDQIIDQVITKVKADTVDIMDNAPAARTMNSLRILSGKSKKKVERAKEFLGIEGDVNEYFLNKFREGGDTAADALEELELLNMFVKEGLIEEKVYD